MGCPGSLPEAQGLYHIYMKRIATLGINTKACPKDCADPSMQWAILIHADRPGTVYFLQPMYLSVYQGDSKPHSGCTICMLSKQLKKKKNRAANVVIFYLTWVQKEGFPTATLFS